MRDKLECGHSIIRKRIVEQFSPILLFDEDGDKWERTLCYCSFCNKTFYNFERYEK